MHPTNVASSKVTLNWCTVVWCTQNVRSNGSSFTRYQPCQQPNRAVNTSVDIQNALCKATVTHAESHTTRVQWVCSEAENNAEHRAAIVGRSGEGERKREDRRGRGKRAAIVGRSAEGERKREDRRGRGKRAAIVGRSGEGERKREDRRGRGKRAAIVGRSGLI